MRHKIGTAEYKKHGEKYEGQWKEDFRHGQVTYMYTGGAKCEGEWKEDSPDGRGRWLHPRGHYSEGEWKGHLAHGQGTEVFAGGNKYDGEWKNGGMDGQGTMEFDNGDNYEGEWKESMEHGEGAYTYADGGWISGEWYKGVEQTPAAVEALLREYRLEEFLQRILVIGVYAPLDMLLIVSDDLVSIGMQSVHIKQFKQLCDQLRLRQDPSHTDSQEQHAKYHSIFDIRRSPRE